MLTDSTSPGLAIHCCCCILFFPLPIYVLGAMTVVPELSDDTVFCVIRSTWWTVASLKRTWSYVIGLEFGHPKSIGNQRVGAIYKQKKLFLFHGIFF
ncbi:hypothetical protein NPIL_663341 [Nephila pilipes]|uniref:Uncharacterized protein n=1 Tax=Nephila pilipes TaxID=299642 RepID=A0A8X6TR98_NEPPI|nr:hypothetical protein NPIL_663341 [Nephila pilipes]